MVPQEGRFFRAEAERVGMTIPVGWICRSQDLRASRLSGIEKALVSGWFEGLVENMMRKVLFLLGFALLAGLLPTSCATNPGYYQPVVHGGITYYYYGGSYYRRYWYGYRPCPKPPGRAPSSSTPTSPATWTTPWRWP